NNLATTYVQEKRFDEAIPLYEQALRINPRFEEALFNMAFCLYSIGKPDEALEKVLRIPTESERKAVFIQEITKAIESNQKN
ncbi:MAG: tetratricopeptide repeat protein, partial [Saprospiraceae bacterium]|nr:tetratricopeptide repeat protein [Saprospiraceae bacterium]